MFKGRLQGFIVGILVATLLAATLAFANVGVMREVFYGVRVMVDGEVQTFDADSQPFISGNRTFLPLRAIAEALDIEITWDEATNTVFIGEVPEPEPEVVYTYGFVFATERIDGRDLVRLMHIDGRVSIRRFAATVVGSDSFSSATDLVGRLIRFDVNDSGEINWVEIPAPIGDEPQIGENTLVFWVVEETNGGFATDMSGIRPTSSLRADMDYENLQMFGRFPNGDAHVVVIIEPMRYSVSQNAFAVFQSQTQSLNANGEPIVNVTFLQDGVSHTLPTTVTMAGRFPSGADALRRGDVFRFSVNSRNEIDGVGVMFRLGNLGTSSPTIDIVAPYGNSSVNPNSVSSWLLNLPGRPPRIHFGRLDSRANRRIYIGVDDVRSFTVHVDANVYVLDSLRSGAAQLQSGVLTNAHPGDWIVFQEQDYRITDVIIVRAAN